MSNPLLIKRSAVAGKAPAVTDIQLGEIALNTNDGKVFLRKNNGTDSIVEVGAHVFTGDVTGAGNGSIVTTLAPTAVVAGSYGSSTNVSTFTVDAKGRLVAAGTAILTPSWANITGKPTTVAGYGITDALSMAYVTNVVVPGLAGMTPPVGATTDREASPSVGRFRFNTTLGIHEGYTANGWIGMDNVLLANYRGSINMVSGTSTIAYGNAAPTTAQGTQLWSQVVTANNPNSDMVIDFDTMVGCNSSNKYVTMAIFRDATLIGYTITTLGSAGRPTGMSIRVHDRPPAGTTVTYSCRIGLDSAATWYVGRDMTNTMGGVNKSTWTISEVL